MGWTTSGWSDGKVGLDAIKNIGDSEPVARNIVPCAWGKMPSKITLDVSDLEGEYYISVWFSGTALIDGVGEIYVQSSASIYGE